MGVPYKLTRKRNPLNRQETGKWYAIPKSGKAMKEKVMTRTATPGGGTTTSDSGTTTPGGGDENTDTMV